MKILSVFILFFILAVYSSLTGHAQDSNITVTGTAVLLADGTSPNNANVCADTRTGTDNTHFVFNNDATWCDAALPVTLRSFDLSMFDSETVKVAWVTSSEINNDLFRIHRSYDLDSWVIIAEIEGSGTTSVQQTYQVVDGPLFNGQVYYQLEQIDYDGTSEMFDIESIEVTNSARTIDIYPNPSSNVVQVHGIENGGYTLFDGQGQIIDIAAIDGMNTFIDLSSFPPGIYFLNIRMAGGLERRFKLIKDN